MIDINDKKRIIRNHKLLKPLYKFDGNPQQELNKLLSIKDDFSDELIFYIKVLKEQIDGKITYDEREYKVGRYHNYPDCCIAFYICMKRFGMSPALFAKMSYGITKKENYVLCPRCLITKYPEEYLPNWDDMWL